MILVFCELPSKMISRNIFRLNQLIVLVTIIVGALTEDPIPLGDMIPKIDQENFKLIPQGNEYTLKIILPDGSHRDEVVELKNLGTPQQHLVVVGVTNTIYHGASAITTYTADKNGYHVKYTITSNPDDYKHISAAALKSAVG